jgi:COMPASS component SWD1
MLVVTLHAQVQPVFVDLRTETGGRWELETTPEETEGDGEEDEDAPKKTGWAQLGLGHASKEDGS